MGYIEVLVAVNTGTISDITAGLPLGPKVLAVVAPSLRSCKVTEDAIMQKIAVEFAQEMEGRFPIEIAYEVIADPEFKEIGVPLPQVEGADVHCGRLAIESRSATEVKAKEEEGLVSVDPVELPASLIAKTSYPILRAYEYTWRDTGPRALFSLLRHRKQYVLPAKVESATSTTTLSVDGSIVTDTPTLPSATFASNSLKSYYPMAAKSGHLPLMGDQKHRSLT